MYGFSAFNLLALKPKYMQCIARTNPFSSLRTITYGCGTLHLENPLLVFRIIERPILGVSQKAHNEKRMLFMKSTWKATKTADSTQISHFDLVFHRDQREGQLGISYILVVFGCAHVCLWCMWCMYVYMVHIYVPVIGDACGAHVCIWCMYVYLCTYVFGGACMCIWCMFVYMVHLCTHVCLVVHVCVYGAHICTFNWWCMCMYVYMVHIYAPLIGDAWCIYVYMVHYAHMCLVVHVVHVCVYGASMHIYLFGGVSGAWMYIWCIYAAVIVLYYVHKYVYM